jgi:FixJ family two-component response regulator
MFTDRATMSETSAKSVTRTVFVIDDDPMIRRALERLLRSAGYDVETFGSAEEFLARDPRPVEGTVLLDVRMQKMSGPALQAQLSKIGHRLSIFFITADDDPRTRAAALAAGARGWFAKPLDGEALLAALRPADANAASM